MALKSILLGTGLESLRYMAGDEERCWEYDVVSVKLECERLQQLHCVTGEPSDAMLRDLAAYLRANGLEGCTNPLALNVHTIVTVKFARIAHAIAVQLENA